MITLKTVLKSGGEYQEKHVLRMRDMLEFYVRCPSKFVCYSDLNIPGIETRPLLHNWPGWWSKIEIFREVEDSFYIDLDMTIQGDITDIVMADSDFMALRNMAPRIEGIGSAMMKWSGDKRFIYETFKSDPEKYMAGHGRDKKGTPWLGDQGFIWSLCKGDIGLFQSSFKGRIKKFNEPGGDIKVYYGRSRPWQNGRS